MKAKRPARRTGSGRFSSGINLQGRCIVLLHDNEPRGSHRSAETNPGDAREIARATPSWRNRQVCRAPLPIAPAIPARLRATEQRQQGYRARDPLKLPNRAELGIQWRLPRVGAFAADS
jgi:hypothetical protein